RSDDLLARAYRTALVDHHHNGSRWLAQRCHSRRYFADQAPHRETAYAPRCLGVAATSAPQLWRVWGVSETPVRCAPPCNLLACNHLSAQVHQSTCSSLACCSTGLSLFCCFNWLWQPAGK